jgi:hypothetical protein
MAVNDRARDETEKDEEIIDRVKQKESRKKKEKINKRKKTKSNK